MLNVSVRQAQRLLARYDDGGGAELIHKARGQTSNRSVNAGIRQHAVDLVKTVPPSAPSADDLLAATWQNACPAFPQADHREHQLEGNHSKRNGPNSGSGSHAPSDGIITATRRCS